MSMLIDFLVICLLITMIFYVKYLTKSLKTFKHLQAEIKPLLQENVQSLTKSAPYATQLRQLMIEVNQTFQKRGGEVQIMTQEMQFMIHHATQVADRLEESLKKSRQGNSIPEEPGHPLLDKREEKEKEERGGDCLKIVPTTRQMLMKRLHNKVIKGKGRIPPLERLKNKKTLMSSLPH